ncbi:disulfide oxidoreductase [Candidatus Beckwithbacteria bacterium CG22_combo_CG10-13_8_21_14_all_01_47_9]|uniref:Disulfide oxidoreductase n=4 Tax=Candidatus Beckwithiibacteriota TaxID=1752726 RepID=A0A2H0E1H6_9BACT|nr:MAG: disulfide oxidoreductase [Candidatus Beckwithbacteria bacterium CG22_combo_CG10-13_8_21_14_all_01_47_9]PJC66779.1 MAG: disulfide oxidoreductase [Candidatus Beckwithbacteria bacterium CG_4_9_14_0_2_um_filter_47_11]
MRAFGGGDMAKTKAKTKVKIGRKMNLAELVTLYPQLVNVLMEDYGLHCVSCFAAGFDTLEEGAKIHGYDDRDIEKMVVRLNKLINK